jgi:hypothetical protein
MFGFGRSKLVKELTQGTHHTIGLLDAAGIGQPAGFWRDAYVLGFLFGTAGTLLNVTSGLRGERAGAILLDTLCALSGPRSDQVTSQLKTLMNSQDADFYGAARLARQIVDYTSGRPVEQGGVDIAEAMKRGRATAIAIEGRSDDFIVRSHTVSALMDQYWIQAVKDRFGIGAE